jgi:hypothetical protein
LVAAAKARSDQTAAERAWLAADNLLKAADLLANTALSVGYLSSLLSPDVPHGTS